MNEFSVKPAKKEGVIEVLVISVSLAITSWLSFQTWKTWSSQVQGMSDPRIFQELVFFGALVLIAALALIRSLSHYFYTALLLTQDKLTWRKRIAAKEVRLGEIVDVDYVASQERGGYFFELLFTRKEGTDVRWVLGIAAWDLVKIEELVARIKQMLRERGITSFASDTHPKK